jgi:hypothetical protein
MVSSLWLFENQELKNASVPMGRKHRVTTHIYRTLARPASSGTREIPEYREQQM